MLKSELKVMIVEDDPTFSRGLVEAINKSGFQALHVARPDEALNASQMQEIHAYVIDCLLPKISGVELAKQIRSRVGAKTPIILTSGIYKDKNFAKEAKEKTQAIAFLEKPFNINELIRQIEKSLEDLIEEPLDPFLEILLKPAASPLERLASLPKSIHAFELLRVFSYLTQKGISGQLTLKDGADDATIHFADGKISQVAVKDPQSYFGSLLIEKNLLTAAELELALSKPSQKRIGERMVDENLLSPHMISIINSEQMAIRLSRLVKETMYEITWAEGSQPTNDSNIEQTLLYNFMSDWIQSKVSLSWLRTFFIPIMENPLVRTPFTNSQHTIYNAPWVDETKGVILSALGQKSLHQLINEFPLQEGKILGALYLMICTQQAAFDRVAKMGDTESQKNRLHRVLDDMKKKNYFEILGLNPKSRAQDFKRAYHDLAKSFHPDKLPPGTAPEVVSLTKEIFSVMTAAYETLTNDAKKTVYLKELEQGKAEKILQSEALSEEGKHALKSGQITKAVEKFKEAISLRPPSSDLNLHFLWARLVQYSSSSAGMEELRELEEGLNRIPPEDRHSALYYFVKGLLQKCQGDLNSAKRNLQHAVSLSPNLIEAQRELNLVRNTPEDRPVDIFRDDLSKVVSHIFKKK